MCNYQKAVTAYSMARRFAKVNKGEANSYDQLARDLIRRYIDQCHMLTQDDYLDVWLNVVSDATGYHKPARS